ncbi:hypothetical protein EW146_g4031 [Bondarzewia mesenterica]|uniref:Uncharacterized protein n=1 Tax=Bondarzewia mesenterica TaxID=1095465 RepID=A0A4V3XF87_9AGAM|nr:hypothetical protein EW146_g4031 [Bondarzewia mesenterica]
MASQLPSDQENLSEQLQLLQELGCAAVRQAARVHSNRDFRSSNTNTDIRILDTIALSLTTGKPGGVVAAAFDRREHLCLVLAKNGAPTPEDESAAQRFISAITNPATRSGCDLFPFLLSRCRANMDKRIANLHKSISNFCDLDLDSALLKYMPRSTEEKFPHSLFYREMMYLDAEPSFHAIISDLVHGCSNNSTFELNPDNISSSWAQYAKLYVVADILAHTCFLKELTSSNSACRERAERLKWCLTKVCQYIDGIDHLIWKVKRWFPNGQIPYRWVNDSFIGTGEGTFELRDDPMDAVWRGFGSHSPLSAQTLHTLAEKFPDIARNWEQQRTVTPCIHAEIRIILHLSSSLLPYESRLETIQEQPAQQAIGCSKRSCFCCTLWIDAYNDFFGTRWVTSRSHGKPYANFGLPGAACEHAMGQDGRSAVDGAVLRGVSIWLKDSLAWLFPGQRRISDEYVSSSDESSGEEDWRGALMQRILDTMWKKNSH